MPSPVLRSPASFRNDSVSPVAMTKASPRVLLPLGSGCFDLTYDEVKVYLSYFSLCIFVYLVLIDVLIRYSTKYRYKILLLGVLSASGQGSRMPTVSTGRKLDQYFESTPNAFAKLVMNIKI